MARTNTLSNFLTDVANAIRTKKGTEATIAASAFDTEILNLPGGTYQTKTLTISANGSQTITPDQGYDAIDEITITTQVPQKQLQSKTYSFNTNQTVELTPDTGYDGFDVVTLTINVPGQQINNQDKTVTQNGQYTADQGYTGLGTVTVNVPSQQINNQDKTITQNGVYTADSGYTGLGQVDVNVGEEPDVRLFINKQSAETYMDLHTADITEGKYCTIYGDLKIFGITPNEIFLSLYLPQTIVFDEEVTSGISLNMQGRSSHSGGGYGYGYIEPTQIYFEWGMMGGAQVTYTSEDGITYIRNGDPVIEDYGWSEFGFNWDSNTNMLYFVDTYSENWQFWYTNTDVYWPQFMKTGKPAYDGFYQYKNVSTTEYRQTALNINDWYTNTLPTSCEYLYMNGLTTSYPMFGKTTRTYVRQGKTINEMNYILGNKNGYSNTIFVDGNTCRVGYHITRSNLTGETSYSYSTVALDGTETSQTITRSYSSCPNYLVSSTYHIFFELFNFPTSEIDDWYIIKGSSNNTVYIAKNSWTNANVSALTWPTNSTSVAFMEMQPPASQITLNNVNQLLPNIIAIGVNGETIGDGSIYHNLDKDTVIKDILNLTQTGTTGSQPLYCPIPTVYDATGGTEAALLFVKPVQEDYDFVLHENNIISGNVTLLYTSINSTIYDTNRDVIISIQTNRIDSGGTITTEYHLVYQQISTGNTIYDTTLDQLYTMQDADDYVLLTYTKTDYTNNLVLFYIKAYSKTLNNNTPTIRNILSSSVTRNSNYEYRTQAYYWDGVVVYNNSYRDKPNKKIYHRVYMYKLSTGSNYTIRNTSTNGYSTGDDYYGNVAIVLSCFTGIHNFYLTCTYSTGSYYASGTCYRINTTNFTCSQVGSASGSINNSHSSKMISSNLFYATDYTILLRGDYRTKISNISDSGQIHYTVKDQDDTVYINNEFASSLPVLQDSNTSDNYLVSYKDNKLYKIITINWASQSSVTFTIDKNKMYDFGSNSENISVVSGEYKTVTFNSDIDVNYITIGTDNCVVLHIKNPIKSGATTYWTTVKFIPIKITDSTDFNYALIRRNHNYFVLDKHTSEIIVPTPDVQIEL